jgi:hypothetical protein
LLGPSQLASGTERGLACAHACLLPKLAQARKGLAELGACPVELACLLPKDAAKLLLRPEALLSSLAHLLGKALLGCELLPGGRLKHLTVALPRGQALLRRRAGHACQLLLGAKALSCGLAELAGKGLLGCKSLLGFGAKLPGHCLRCPELLGASLADTTGLSGLCAVHLLSLGAKLSSQSLLRAKALCPGLSEAAGHGRLGRKALGLGLPHGRCQALLSPELLTGKTGETGSGGALSLTLAGELAHGRLLGPLEAARADSGQGLTKAAPQGLLALSGAQASSGAECGLTAPGDVTGAGCDVLLCPAFKDVLHGLLDHALLKGVVKLPGHAGVKAASSAAQEAGGFAQGAAKLTSCLLGHALDPGQAAAELAGCAPGHAELLPKAALQGANAAPESAGGLPKARPEAARCALPCGQLLPKGLAKLSLTTGELAGSGAHALSKLSGRPTGNVLDLA